MDIIIAEAEKFVVFLLTDKLDAGFLYHNLSHTQRVVSKTIELAELSELSKHKKDILTLCAWFHDTGFTKSPNNHEKLSADIAREFLEKHDVPQKDILSISKIILATKLDYIPSDEFEKIIRDADSAYVASDQFIEISTLLRKEWEQTIDKKLTEMEWQTVNLNFLTQGHQFHTAIASSNWNKGKQENLEKIHLNIKKLKAGTFTKTEN